MTRDEMETYLREELQRVVGQHNTPEVQAKLIEELTVFLDKVQELVPSLLGIIPVVEAHPDDPTVAVIKFKLVSIPQGTRFSN